MRPMLETLMLLKQVSYFQLLRTDQLRHIVPVLEPAGWSAGERVFDIGDPSDNMFVIVSGRVGISIDNNPARQAFVTELTAGDCFGEMGILDDQVRSATVHVLEDTEALALGKEKFHGLLLSYPELGIGVMRALSRRLRATSRELADARTPRP